MNIKLPDVQSFQIPSSTLPYPHFSKQNSITQSQMMRSPILGFPGPGPGPGPLPLPLLLPGSQGTTDLFQFIPQEFSQGSSTTFGSGLFENEEKNVKDIMSLLKCEVDISIIASVKNTTIQKLMEFISLKQIPLPHSKERQQQQQQQQQHINSLLPLQLLPVPGYILNRKKTWKRGDFPAIKKGDFYCADCKITNVHYHCKCKRKCWRWCDLCNSYFSNHHNHFKIENKKNKKRRRPWSKDDFPKVRVGGYYCVGCESSSSKRLCKCKRDCWKWCEICHEYRSKHHFTSDHVTRRYLNNIGIIQPPLKRRKII